jgi:hypothetical protein
MNWLKATAISIVAIFAPIHAMIITIHALIAADTVTGIWAALKRGEKLSSAGLRRTVTKALVYTLSVICAYACQKYLISDLMPLANIAAGAIGVVELKSILENADSIVGGSLFKSLIEKLGSVNDKTKE